MSGLQIFSFKDGLIRTEVSKSGEPLICAADLARIVGLVSPERAYARIDAEYRVMRNTHTPSGSQQMVFLTEPGVYQFLLGLRIKAGSKHHERIKQFQKHVFEVVLPTIRRTGSYGGLAAPDEPVALSSYVTEFEAGIRVAELCGQKGNQPIITADNRLKRNHGVSLLAELQIALPAPENKVQRTATQVGVAVGEKTGTKLSAVAANKRIAEAGWQVKHPSGDGWAPTPLGEVKGGTLIDCGKSHGNGKSIQMLVWVGDDVVELLCGSA